MIWVLFLFLPPVEGDGPELYPVVPMQKIATGHWYRPRAKVTGTVTYVKKEDDGDWHFRLESEGQFIICEIIPELPIAPPKAKDKVEVQGVARYDGQHRWYELHPVVSWKKIP